MLNIYFEKDIVLGKWIAWIFVESKTKADANLTKMDSLKKLNYLCITTSQHSSSLAGKMKHFRSLKEKKFLNRYFHGQTNVNNPFFLCNLFLTSYRWNKNWGERGERFSPSSFYTIIETWIKIKIKQSPALPFSAGLLWLSSAYFPLALFRLVLPVCDETEGKEPHFDKCKISTRHGRQSLHKALATSCPEVSQEEWRWQLERDDAKK